MLPTLTANPSPMAQVLVDETGYAVKSVAYRQALTITRPSPSPRSIRQGLRAGGHESPPRISPAPPFGTAPPSLRSLAPLAAPPHLRACGARGARVRAGARRGSEARPSHSEVSEARPSHSEVSGGPSGQRPASRRPRALLVTRPCHVSSRPTRPPPLPPPPFPFLPRPSTSLPAYHIAVESGRVRHPSSLERILLLAVESRPFRHVPFVSSLSSRPLRHGPFTTSLSSHPSSRLSRPTPGFSFTHPPTCPLGSHSSSPRAHRIVSPVL